LVAYKAEGPVTLNATDGVCSTAGTGGAGASLTIQNANPVAAAHSLTRAPSASLKILKTDLLAGATDANHDRISFSSVQSPSGNASVFHSGDYVYYLPGSTGDGATFTYTVSDGQGGSATATVTINVVTPGGIAKEITVSGGTVTITFFGIPGFQYDLQRATSVDGPYTTLTAAGTQAASSTDGRFSFTDTVSDGVYFYRSIQH
jgi:hypothetical protein